MNRHLIRLAAALAAVLAAAAAYPQAAPSSSFGHYQVASDRGEARALEIARTLEAAFALFGDTFHPEAIAPAASLRVRIFGVKADYDAYLQSLIGETRPDFVYVSYRDPARSELVGFERPAAEFNRSLLHYGLIQFLSILQPTTPLWLAEGAAAYLEASTLQDGRFVWQPNYAWLDSLKGQLAGGQARLPITELLAVDKTRAAREINTFYPAAWGLVHFLAQSPEKRYNRLLWDSMSAVQPAATLAENSARIVQRAFAWVDGAVLQRDFEAFILGIRTFGDLLKKGTDDFTAGRLEEAEKALSAATALRPDSYTPYYYLGLISYQRKNYVRAAELYTRSMELGIEPALIQYALGVNAFADKKYAEAAVYLRRAKELDPKAYGEKADSLLKRIEALK
jgi:tetratricopeptide (TPR) repeat protein